MPRPEDRRQRNDLARIDEEIARYYRLLHSSWEMMRSSPVRGFLAWSFLSAWLVGVRVRRAAIHRGWVRDS